MTEATNAARNELPAPLNAEEQKQIDYLISEWNKAGRPFDLGEGVDVLIRAMRGNAAKAAK